jgi:NAD(P)H-nitrite reductase large subunit
VKKDILEKGAILQRDRETYAIAPHIPGGITDTVKLRKICDVAEKYKVQAVKLTSAQRIALVGVKEEDLDAIWEELDESPGAAIGLCVRSVKICPGTTFCKRGMMDSVGLGLKLDAIYHSMVLPNKLKMGVSGCMLSCSEVWVKDIGIMGTPKGWRVIVGGNSGMRPRIGDVLAENIAADEEVLEIVAKIIDFYKNSGKKERVSVIVEQMGIEEFRKTVLG